MGDEPIAININTTINDSIPYKKQLINYWIFKHTEGFYEVGFVFSYMKWNNLKKYSESTCKHYVLYIISMITICTQFIVNLLLLVSSG